MDNTLASLEERLNEPNWSGFQAGAPQLQWASSYGSTNGAGLISSAANSQRVVVIQRDERGFGFVVAGDNPVFVQTVREGGAAERAGIFKDDIIIKVNGSWVTQSNHAEVVDLIRAGGSCVALTVISPVYGSAHTTTSSNTNGVQQHYSFGMPSSTLPSSSAAPPPPPPPPATPTSRGLHHQPSMRGGGITSPQPVGHEQQRVVELERLNTFKLMLEKEQQFVEAKRSDLVRGYNPTVAIELSNAEKRVRELQQKYNQMANRLGLSTSESQPLLTSSAHRSPSPANRPQSAHYPSGASRSGSRLSQRPPGPAEGGGWDNLGCDVPPPLPARNRSLVSQHSSPLLISSPVVVAAGECPVSPPPPLPPRNPSSASSSSCSSSSSNSAGGMPDVVPPANSHELRTQLSPTVGSGRQSTSPLPSHHRTKSSPFPFPVQPVATAGPDTRRFSSSDSISELDLSARRAGGPGSKDTDSPSHGTPPGTPPPPYRRPVSPLAEDGNGSETVATGSLPASHQASPPGVVYAGQETQLNILSMEEDDFSDHETGQIDDHGVFKTFTKLWQHNAHLAVFMNYVMSNCDPASLYFHLITDLYKEGTAKDMKKWAYEIHSTFLVPNAPLKVTNVDEHVLHEIDDALQVDIDKEEILRKVFWKARSKAKEELKRHLAEFRSKRTVGLATIFGPPDSVLDETIQDKVKEMKIIETILLPRLESFTDDLENSNDRMQAIASSLATVLQKNFNLKSPQATSQIERCPTFVAKEKSIKSKFLSKNKKQLTAKGHHFVAHQYFSVTQCNHCGNVLWGMSPQGYQCTNCEMNIHKGCVKVIEESCIGALHRKERGNDRISKIVDRFRPERELKRKLTTSQGLGDKKRADDSLEASITGSLDSECSTGDKQSGIGSSSNGRSFTDGSRDGARDRRSGTGSGSDSFGEADRRAGYTPPYEEELDSSSASIVNKKKVSRSESLRERAQRKHREKRKHSDPNLPPSHSSDMDREDRSLSNNNSGSSSNSSLSTSLESPSPSDIRVSGSALSDASCVSTALSMASSSVASSSAGGVLTPWDSDLEADPDPPDWTRNLDPDAVDKMSPKEKQRQEVVNELFHTERSHVRNLKVLERVFYRPLLDNGYSDLVNLLFPNLPEMLEIHGRFNALMKGRKRDQPAVEGVGDILVAMFDGPNGEMFQQAAATFCKYQSVALENLRDRRKKESKLQAFLAEAEGNSVCRRLQLKDIIPTAMQRLTKYPLLLESLAKYTQPRSEEMTTVRKCLERSREILNKVNQAIKEAENYNRLVDIQRRLDKSAFDKSDHPIANELKNFDLTKHRLIYEGALLWRTKGQKNVDLHVVLLEEYILLLQKQDDKYVLKFHSINYLNSKEESKYTHSPIIKIATVLVRPVATDKLALYLVNTSPTGAQIYDLVAVSIAERKAWFRHITDATEAYKTREGRNRRPDGSGSFPMGSATSSLHSSSSSAHLLSPHGADQSDKIKEDDPVEDNVSADSGVSLTPSSNETAPPVEPTAEQPQQQQQPPNNLEAAQADASKKAGESGNAPPASGSASPASGSTAASPAPQRRLQRVEILKIAEGTPLIDPTEVVVSQGAVLHAEPVLTPLETLRRKDQMIRAALADKQRLVADILHVPHSELETPSELQSELEGEKEARMLVMTAIAQATQLTAVLNDSLRITEEEAIAAVSADHVPVASPSSPRSNRRINRMPGAPTGKLLAITGALNRDLTQLLGIVTSRDDERDQLRRELQKTRDQLTELLVLQAAASQPTTTSRPVSHVSLSDCEATVESEQSEGTPASPETAIETPGGDGECHDRSESLVEERTIAPVEDESTAAVFEELDNAINLQKTTDEEPVGAIILAEKTELEASESSEA